MSENGDVFPGMRILIIAAHPDDIEIGVGGALARWVGQGAQVSYAIVTDGAAGNNEPGADLAALAAQRQEEQRSAAALLGVDDIHYMGYRDGVLEPSLTLRRDLTRLIRQLKPDRVVCQDPTTVFVGDGYVNHPDHRAAGEAATYAVFPSAVSRPIFPELLDEGLEPHRVKELYLNLTLHPDLYVDISDVMDRKVEALLCHRSQVGEEAADWIREMNAEMGKQIGCAYAEAFRVLHLADDDAADSDEAPS
jgi:LmbE family N-acetylglucosaminyl deacetylase